MKKRIILIGALNRGFTAKCGETRKNQLFESVFNEHTDYLNIIDTYDWKKKPFIIFKIFYFLIFYPSAKVILSCSPVSAYQVIKFLFFFRLNKNVYYWVVGGSFSTSVEKGIFKQKYFKYLNAIIVQSETMKLNLEKIGFENIKHINNSKPIFQVEKKLKKENDNYLFVFLSRIDITKGCNYIFEAVNKLNSEGFQNKFTVDFYGEISVDYKSSFLKSVNENVNTKYNGFLNLIDTSSYNTLASYDVMLFPTFWVGEGFPGVILDAFISGLPTIASDWNLNKHVIKNGETGLIIPVNDVEALTDAMRSVINNQISIESMSRNCLNSSKEYDSLKILSKETLAKIGLL